MHRCALSVMAFHNLADRYRENYMDLTLYNDSYREFCELLPPGHARELGAACASATTAPGHIDLEPALADRSVPVAHRPNPHFVG